MRTAAHIIETVGKLVKKYDTRDPYELCKCLEIKIHFYNLEKKLKGFFFYQSRQKNIVIDSNVNDVLERILIAHELGHIVSCPKILQQENRTSNNFNPQCNRKIEQLCSRNDWQFIFLL